MSKRGTISVHTFLEQAAHLLYTAKEQSYRGQNGGRVSRQIGQKGMKLLNELEGFYYQQILVIIRWFFVCADSGEDCAQQLGWLRRMSEQEIRDGLVASFDFDDDFLSLSRLVKSSEAKKDQYDTYPLMRIAHYGGALARWRAVDPTFEVVHPALNAYSLLAGKAGTKDVDEVIASIDATLAILSRGGAKTS